ncbi:MAG: hypothetical protein Q7S06_04015 [Nanoarchaeota archaeon]|nr:hypothetical protein [Nanoarchaeota archaeon]
MLSKQEILNKIKEKKEFSQLPEKDVETAFSHFEKRQTTDEDKVKLTRDLLRKVFSVFTSSKILSLKNKEEISSEKRYLRTLKNRSEEWILRKHISTRERIDYYEEIYKRILKDLNKKINIIDLGAGINGFSYKYFKKFEVKYIGVEAIGQLVELMNFYFKRKKLNGEAIHLSLFELEKIKSLIKKQKGQKIIFLFKTLDSLEMLQRDYSTKFLEEIVPLSDRVIVSFATRSIGKRERFKIKRNWILKFIKDNFKILNDFEIEGERYLVFENEKK